MTIAYAFQICVQLSFPPFCVNEKVYYQIFELAAVAVASFLPTFYSMVCKHFISFLPLFLPISGPPLALFLLSNQDCTMPVALENKWCLRFLIQSLLVTITCLDIGFVISISTARQLFRGAFLWIVAGYINFFSWWKYKKDEIIIQIL